ncbi:MAG: FxsA family protein [Campylobacter sp.]
MLKILILPYLIVEFFSTSFFVSAYGFLGLFIETILTGFLGAILISRIGFLNLFSRLMFLSSSDIFSYLGIAIGGFLLFIPGIVTDILGIIIVAICFLETFQKPKERFYSQNSSAKQPKNDDEIIDVEIIEERRV